MPESVVRQRSFVASGWWAVKKNNLQGFCTITLSRGLRIKKPDGSTSYILIPNVSTDQAEHLFRGLALAAVDDFLLGVHPCKYRMS